MARKKRSGGGDETPTRPTAESTGNGNGDHAGQRHGRRRPCRHWFGLACRICGAPFAAQHSDARFCSPRCRQRFCRGARLVYKSECLHLGTGERHSSGLPPAGILFRLARLRAALCVEKVDG